MLLVDRGYTDYYAEDTLQETEGVELCALRRCNSKRKRRFRSLLKRTLQRSKRVGEQLPSPALRERGWGEEHASRPRTTPPSVRYDEGAQPCAPLPSNSAGRIAMRPDSNTRLRLAATAQTQQARQTRA